LITPTRAPAATPTAAPKSIGRCQFAYAAAVSTDVMPATEPTDRSNCPHINGTIEPSAITASTAWLVMMLRMLSGWT